MYARTTTITHTFSTLSEDIMLSLSDLDSSSLLSNYDYAHDAACETSIGVYNKYNL